MLYKNKHDIKVHLYTLFYYSFKK